MAPVEWTVISGEQAEAVLSNLLYSDNPDAVRVRPSQGDLGIDVLIPIDPSGEPFDVYQIKKFADNLGDSEKRQVKASFRRFLVGVGRHQLPARHWYLMTPLDPTIDNRLDWFKAMQGAVVDEMFKDPKLNLTAEEKRRVTAWREAEDRKIEWKGRTVCDNLAAKYPFVIDYYLHGGRDTLREAIKDVTALLKTDQTLPDSPSTDTAALVTPSELYAHLANVQSLLDTDPHYRYGLSLDPTRPEVVEQPDLVAATQITDPDGQTITFRIYQRFAESLNERPIPIKLSFAVGDATFDRNAFELWRKYGRAMTAPAIIEADLPGGLGGAFSGELSQVSIGTAGETQDARFRFRRPDGSYSSELPFSITVTGGTSGNSGHGKDKTDRLTFDFISDVDTRTGTWNFKRETIVGAEVLQALPTIEFLQDLRPPNVLQVAQKYGPFVDYAEVPAVESLVFPDPVMAYLRGLASIQPHVATPILVPDLTKLTLRDVRSVAETTSLLDGQTVVSSWDELTMAQDPSLEEDGPETDVDLTQEYQLLVMEQLVLTVDDQKLILGTVSKCALSARYEVQGDKLIARPYRNDALQKNFSPNADAAQTLDRRVLGRVVGPLSD